MTYGLENPCCRNSDTLFMGEGNSTLACHITLMVENSSWIAKSVFQEFGVLFTCEGSYRHLTIINNEISLRLRVACIYTCLYLWLSFLFIFIVSFIVTNMQINVKPLLNFNIS